jgi:glutathione S-transferase
MPMILHASPSSPFVRKVRVLLLEAGNADAVTLAAATGTPIDAAKMPVDSNPLGKIPVLERDDGPPVHDSRVICRYLDHRLNAGLYPEPPNLWRTLTLESMADGIADASILIRYEQVLRDAAFRSDAWIAGQWAKIARALDEVESRWLAHLAGPLDMGQVALGAALGHLDFRHAGRDWANGRPGLAAWWAGFSARPSMAATAPIG